MVGALYIILLVVILQHLVVLNHQAESKSTPPKFFARLFFYPAGPISGYKYTTMLIYEITENLASTLAKGAATALKSAPTLAKGTDRVAELLQRQQANLAQIDQLANSRDFRALPDALQRLKQFHSDLYDIAHVNSQNQRVVAEVNRLRDDLVPILRNMEINSNQPGASSVFLQSISRELVPVLKDSLRSLEAILKTSTTE
jgi:hypothetical protein